MITNISIENYLSYGHGPLDTSFPGVDSDSLGDFLEAVRKFNISARYALASPIAGQTQYETTVRLVKWQGEYFYVVVDDTSADHVNIYEVDLFEDACVLARQIAEADAAAHRWGDWTVIEYRD